MWNRNYIRILRGQSWRASIWRLGIQGKESKENEEEEFSHKNNMGKFLKILRKPNRLQEPSLV